MVKSHFWQNKCNCGSNHVNEPFKANTMNMYMPHSKNTFLTKNNEIEIFNAIKWFYFFELTASNQ